MISIFIFSEIQRNINKTFRYLNMRDLYYIKVKSIHFMCTAFCIGMRKKFALEHAVGTMHILSLRYFTHILIQRGVESSVVSPFFFQRNIQ